MSKEIIAVVRLTAGESGYYDELSCIHLTQSNPQRDVYAGTNCTQLRRSVKSGRLRLLSGSLGEEKKLDLSKKGNKYTGAPLAAIRVPVPQDPIVEVAPVVEASVEESGVVEIAPVQPEVVEVTEEGVEKKASRKKTNNR